MRPKRDDLPMSRNTLTPNKPKFRRKIWSATIAMIAILAAGWTALWFAVSLSTQDAINLWFSAERAAGRVWQCGGQSISGFPLFIRYRCTDPVVSGAASGVTFAGSVGNVNASASVFDPGVIVADIDSPVSLKSRDEKYTLALSWQNARLRIETASGEMNALSLSVAKLIGQLQGPRIEASPFDAEKFGFSLRYQLADLSSYRDLAVQIDASEIRSRQLEKFIDEGASANLHLTARISNAEVAGSTSFLQAVEIWRRSKGALNLTEVHFDKGAFSFDGSGTLGLDDLRRPQGAINIGARNFGPVGQKLGIPTSVLSVGDFLSGLTRRKKQTDEPAPDKTPNLTVKMQNGRLFVGSFPTPVFLPGLY